MRLVGWGRNILWLSLFLLPVFCLAQKELPPAFTGYHPKLAPILQSRVPANKVSSYRIQVTDPVTFVKWQQEKMPAVVVSRVVGLINTFTVTTTNARELPQLLNCPWVTYIDIPSRTPREELALNNPDLTANAVEAVHTRFPNLNGNGLVASLKEKPFDTTDIDLKGRIIRSPALQQAPTVHATTMATLLAGAGNSAPSGKGVAWQARLLSADFANLLPDDEQTLRAAKVSVQNHSYGVNPENYYGLEAQAYDQQSRLYPELLHVFSSGNAGTEALTTGPYAGLTGWANITGQFKLSKNTLSVGATDTSGQINPISSRGPAYDGRIKPELVAYGEGGTSEAAALVSGVALLVQQAYREQHANTLPPASLVKAVLINTADDLGRAQVDFETGFGQVNAVRAVQAVRQKQFFTGQVAKQGVKTFTIPVPVDARLLKVTLVWHDPESAPEAPQALVNDLDLALEYTPGRTIWQPWVLSSYPHPDSLRLPARPGVDRINNVEQITVNKPVAGSYTVRVNGYNVPQGPQTFSLVYETQPGIFWTFPNTGSTLVAGVKNRLRWQGQTQATTGRLEYRALPQGNWQLIKEAAVLNKASFDWLTPSTATFAQLRLTTINETVISDSFLVAPALNVKEGYNCGNEAMFYWPAQKGADEYQIWQLGATALEPLRRTTDTVLVISNSQAAVRYAVAPMYKGFTATNSGSIDISQMNCYVKSFLPRQLVTDTVAFDLELNTFYKVAELVLEKLINGIFKPIQTVPPAGQINFVFNDPAPQPGRQVYRIRIVNQQQEVFYGPTEAVFYSPAGFLQLFPNPVSRGQELNIVVASDKVTPIQVYDRLGRLIAEYQESGVIKVVPTAELGPGLYFIRVQTPTGKLLTTRLVVL